jgi:hypothetical protein
MKNNIVECLWMLNNYYFFNLFSNYPKFCNKKILGRREIVSIAKSGIIVRDYSFCLTSPRLLLILEHVVEQSGVKWNNLLRQLVVRSDVLRRISA